jgi:hypothetical protein
MSQLTLNFPSATNKLVTKVFASGPLEEDTTPLTVFKTSDVAIAAVLFAVNGWQSLVSSTEDMGFVSRWVFNWITEIADAGEELCANTPTETSTERARNKREIFR